MTAVDEVPLLPTRTLAAGQRTEVWVVDSLSGAPELVYTSEELLLEAPNWAPDGAGLLLNGHGLLWRLDAGADGDADPGAHRRPAADQQRPRRRRAPRTDLPLRQRRTPLRRPDRRRHRHPGQPRPHPLPLPARRQPRRRHPGVRRPAPGRLLRRRPARPDSCRRGRDQLPGGRQPPHRRARVLRRRRLDLPEHRGVRRPARPRPARPRPGDRRRPRAAWSSPTPSTGSPICHRTGPTPPTSASRPAPSATPPTSTSRSTSSHTNDWTTPLRSIPLFGGQGTINVNSWSPDGRRFAYVAYPITTANA